MRKSRLYSILLAVLFCAILIPLNSLATTYTFTPYDGSNPQNDLYDLDHSKIYLWGINWSLPAGEKITKATVFFDDIYNWQVETNVLKFYLLDNVKINDNEYKVDIITLTDNQLTDATHEIGYYESKKFSDYIPLSTWSDSDGTQSTNDVTYTFTDPNQIETLTNYLASENKWWNNKTNSWVYYNANIGLGFDPDCHFYNSGVTFTIETSPVPEPTAMLLLGFGLIGLAGLRRKFRG